ncbi:unnamed protein product [Absidia cylindrospora]
MVYDFLINLYMTILFVLPLMKIGTDTNVDWKQSRLHEVAKRTTLASVVCLIASFANVTALAVLNGLERGVVCLTCCFVDVMVNVVTVHWVTSQPAGKTTRETVISNNKSNPYDDDVVKGRDSVPSSPTNPNEQQTSTHTDSSSTTVVNPTNVIPTDKKKRFHFDPPSEQYGEFGHHAWPPSPDYTAPADVYNTHHYMSATNNQIYTSPANATATDYHHYHHQHQQLPAYQQSHTTAAGHTPYHFMNGRFVMISEREDDDFQTSSQSSSIQECHSSKKSLTKIPSNSSSYHHNL